MNTEKYNWMLGTYGERVAAVLDIDDSAILFDICCSAPERETRLAAAYKLQKGKSDVDISSSYGFTDEVFSPHADLLPKPYFSSFLYNTNSPDLRASVVPFLSNYNLLREMAVYETDIIVIYEIAHYLCLDDLNYVYEHTHFKNESIKSCIRQMMKYDMKYLPRRKFKTLGKPSTKSPGMPPTQIPKYYWQLEDFVNRFKGMFDMQKFSDFREDDIALAIYAMKEKEDLELMRILQNLFRQPTFNCRKFLQAYNHTLVCVELEDDGNQYHCNAGYLRLPVESENFDHTYFEQQDQLLQKESLIRLEKSAI